MIDALLLGSIGFFFLLLFLLGFSLFYISPVSLSDNWFIRCFLYLGTGLGFLVFLIIFFDVVGIPLDYRLFAVVSFLCPLHFVIFRWNSFLSSLKNTFLFSSSKKELLCFGVVFIAAALLFYTFLIGAFAYPYLEDDDPWEHARSVRYIATEKTAFEPYPGEDIFRYTDKFIGQSISSGEIIAHKKTLFKTNKVIKKAICNPNPMYP